MAKELETIKEFLKESNAIEGVYDFDSLLHAVDAWQYLSKRKVMTTGLILKVHKILMLNQPLQPDERGYFRKVPVWIGGKEGIQANRIPEEIVQWTKNVNDLIRGGKKESDIFKERVSKIQHIEYERIHPFIDGNGRTGRMFMNWTRLRIGLPVLVIHEGKEQMEYYKWFK